MLFCIRHTTSNPGDWLRIAVQSLVRQSSISILFAEPYYNFVGLHVNVAHYGNLPVSFWYVLLVDRCRAHQPKVQSGYLPWAVFVCFGCTLRLLIPDNWLSQLSSGLEPCKVCQDFNIMCTSRVSHKSLTLVYQNDRFPWSPCVRTAYKSVRIQPMTVSAAPSSCEVSDSLLQKTTHRHGTT